MTNRWLLCVFCGRWGWRQAVIDWPVLIVCNSEACQLKATTGQEKFDIAAGAAAHPVSIYPATDPAPEGAMA